MVFPNPFRAAVSLFRAVRAHFRGDSVFVSGRTLQKRRSLCNTCFHRDPQSDQCRLCTCFLALKTQLSTEKCPVDRW
jgi:hypothetical protein